MNKKPRSIKILMETIINAWDMWQPPRRRWQDLLLSGDVMGFTADKWPIRCTWHEEGLSRGLQGMKIFWVRKALGTKSVRRRKHSEWRNSWHEECPTNEGTAKPSTEGAKCRQYFDNHHLVGLESDQRRSLAPLLSWPSGRSKYNQN